MYLIKFDRLYYIHLYIKYFGNFTVRMKAISFKYRIFMRIFAHFDSYLYTYKSLYIVYTLLKNKCICYKNSYKLFNYNINPKRTIAVFFFSVQHFDFDNNKTFSVLCV